MLSASVRMEGMQPLDEAVLKNLKYARSSAEDLAKEFDSLSEAGVDVESILKSGKTDMKAWSEGVEIAGNKTSELHSEWLQLVKVQEEWKSALDTDVTDVISSNIDWEGIEKYIDQTMKAREYAKLASDEMEGLEGKFKAGHKVETYTGLYLQKKEQLNQVSLNLH